VGAANLNFARVRLENRSNWPGSYAVIIIHCSMSVGWHGWSNLFLHVWIIIARAGVCRPSWTSASSCRRFFFWILDVFVFGGSAVYWRYSRLTRTSLTRSCPHIELFFPIPRISYSNTVKEIVFNRNISWTPREVPLSFKSVTYESFPYDNVRLLSQIKPLMFFVTD